MLVANWALESHKIVVVLYQIPLEYVEGQSPITEALSELVMGEALPYPFYVLSP